MIDLSKASAVVDSTGAIPNQLRVSVTYVVAQGKGFGTKLAGRFGAKLDLDSMLLCFNTRNEVISVCGPQHPSPFGGAVVHQGDAKAGAGGAATETILIAPAAVPMAVHGMILAVVAYGNSAAFGKLAQLVFTLTDGEGRDLAQDFISIEGNVQGQMMFKLVRNGTGWNIEPFSRGVGRASKWEDVASAARSELVMNR